MRRAARPGPRVMAAGLGLLQILNWATTFYLPAIVAEPVARDLGVSRAAALGAFSWALLVSGLCAPRVGRRIERGGGRNTLLLGSLVQGSGLALLAATPSLPVWYLVWTWLGLGMALGLYDAAFATVGRQLGAEARPVIIGVTLLGGFASTVGWPLGTWMFAHAGWRATALAYAGVHFALCLPLIASTVPRGAPPEPAPRRAATTDGADPNRLGFLFVAGFFTLRALIAGTVSVHVLVLLHGLGLSPEAAVVAAALIGPGQVGARLLDFAFGRYATPLVTSWIGAALLPLGALATLAGMPGTGFTLAYGMSNGILTISRGTLPLYLFGPGGYAVTIGRLAMPVLLAQAIAPTLTAPLLAYPPRVLMLGIAATATLAALCLLPLRRRA